ncbi:hypothetical protein KDK95_01345 [Actinospica sp. MGRD01-02]|uniref:MvdD-like pre-ATP grasp domain-containing protein n=1 Tax=Actinospica acidithermotolerans TaxID=2828514 RepID=A0A941E9B2_9ACTN|nr:hypothetical protein [Actinospica acidithermotolerans]MBR7824934.1 hypothetical protein [Actinospica acidithermotolerans]
MPALILTQRQDITADRVIVKLRELDTPVIRLDYADFPAGAGMTAQFNGGEWAGILRVGSRTTTLREITGVYYRRPSTPRVTGHGSPGRDGFVEKEITLGFGGVLAALPEHLWLGHPATLLAVQRSKPWQLVLADACGLTVPATMVTGDTAHAAHFAAQVGGEVAVKSFGTAAFLGPEGEQEAIYTRRLRADEIRSASLLGIPHQFQRWINAEHAVRLTAVDDELFAAEIHFGSPAARLDWRSDQDSLTYKRVQPPPAVADSVRQLMRRMNLRYGALDFLIDKAGTWWFLEINANGQWAWIDEVSDDIADAIARALTKAPSPE